MASILVDECIFKPAVQDSVAAAYRLRAGRNMRRRSGDQEGSNDKSASGGASVGDSIGVLYTVHSSTALQTHDDRLHWLQTKN